MKASALHSAILGVSALAVLAGCGQTGVMVAPVAKAAVRTLAARDVAPGPSGWYRPATLADFNTEPDTHYFDGPTQNHPFAAPVDVHVHAGVLHLIAPSDSRPRRGYYMFDVDPALGTFDRNYAKEQQDKKATPDLCSRVQVAYHLATDATGGGTSPSGSLPAITVFIVRRQVGKQINLQAIGFATATTLTPGTILPAPTAPGVPARPLQLNYESQVVPLRIMTVQQGTELTDVPSMASFTKLLDPSIQANDTDGSFVKDFYTLFPNPTEGMDPQGGGAEDVSNLEVPLESMTSAPLSAQPPAPDSNQGDLLGIQAIAFGADVEPNVGAQAILDDVTLALSQN